MQAERDRRGAALCGSDIKKANVTDRCVDKADARLCGGERQVMAGYRHSGKLPLAVRPIPPGEAIPRDV